MNKLGNWNNIKDCLPIGGKLVLLKMEEDYDFIFARLYQFNYGNNEVTFIPENDGGRNISSNDVDYWCYAELFDIDNGCYIK